MRWTTWWAPRGLSQRRWNSGAISAMVIACWRLSARATARRVSVRRSARAVLDHLLRIDGRLRARRNDAGEIEPLREPVDPGGLVVKAFGLRRAPQRLAQRGAPAGPARRPGMSGCGAAHGGEPLVRPLELGGASQVSGASMRALAISLRSPSVSRKRFYSLWVSASAARRRRNGARACWRRAGRSRGGAPGSAARRGPGRRRHRDRSWPITFSAPARAGAD